MTINFVSVTEVPGRKATKEELQMLCLRYHVLSRYAQGKRVLEVACGPGVGLGYLAEKTEQVIGGDYSKDLLRIAQKHYGGAIGLVCLNAETLPFEDNYFEVVGLLEAIYYLPEPDRFIDEAYRVLKQNGTLILCLPNVDRPKFCASPLSHKYFSVPELSNLLFKHKFDVKIFGAFPVHKGGLGKPKDVMIRIAVSLGAGKLLRTIPKGNKLKEFLLGQNMVLKEEIEKEIQQGLISGIQLSPLDMRVPDNRYKVLYAIAQKK